MTDFVEERTNACWRLNVDTKNRVDEAAGAAGWPAWRMAEFLLEIGLANLDTVQERFTLSTPDE